MSRLIDADEIIIRLPFTLPRYNMMLLRNSIMQGIQDTPTVDAIPIEWLEKRAKRERRVTVKQWLEKLIKDYREEQANETD